MADEKRPQWQLTASARAAEASRAFASGDVQAGVRLLADTLGYVKWRCGNLSLSGIHQNTREGFMVIGGGPANGVELFHPAGEVRREENLETVAPVGVERREENPAPLSGLESSPTARKPCPACGAALVYSGPETVACVNCGEVFEHFQDDPEMAE